MGFTLAEGSARTLLPLSIAHLRFPVHRAHTRSRAIAILAAIVTAALIPHASGQGPGLQQLAPVEARHIGMRIWQNEGARNPKYLLWWNEGEAFASLGIGHFIWYPTAQPGRFVESFPRLLAHLEGSGIELPPWLRDAQRTGNPWPNRTAFFAAIAAQDPRTTSLRLLLERTVGEQAEFILKGLPGAHSDIIATAPHQSRATVDWRFTRLSSSPQGLYVLADYLNFKGAGTQASERYRGQGWGLLQVLLTLEPPRADTDRAWLDAFASAAERVLARRVTNAPTKRREHRWLPGWKARIRTYRIERNP